jgi:hypothetical protein
MASTRRTVSEPPTHRMRRRARAVAAALAGGVAGLAAGAACVAWPPEGGAGAAPRVAPSKAMAPPGGHRSSSRGIGGIGGVAAVLAPVDEAGVVPSRGRADVGGSP